MVSQHKQILDMMHVSKLLEHSDEGFSSLNLADNASGIHFWFDWNHRNIITSVKQGPGVQVFQHSSRPPRQCCQKGPKNWIKHYYVLLRPLEQPLVQKSQQLKSNLEPLKWSHLTSVSGILLIVSVLSVSGWDGQSFTVSADPFDSIKWIDYQQCQKRTCVCGFFDNDEMGTNKTTITWPFLFPICTYLTLLYTIEIYKYYKMSLFVRWASTCMLLDSKLYLCSSHKISTLQDREDFSNFV